MARIRTVKPEFWTDERVGECSVSARLLFIATWNFSDDQGGLDRSAKQLKAQAFPYDQIDCEPLIQELLDAGLLIEYESCGKKYLHINGFRRHQKVEKPAKPRVPVYEESLRTPRALPEPSPACSGSSLGREGKGKEHTDVEQGSTARSEEPDSPEQSSPVVRIFEHWKSEHRHPKAVLDSKRRKVIGAALKAYSEADLCTAISGYRNSPHNMGQNETRTVYDEITLFLRDAEHIDRGMALARGANGSASQEQIQREIAQGKRDPAGNPIMFGGRQVEWR